jgi:membrane protein YdbS with pleckstrin-like domain
MFENQEISVENLPSAATLDWQSLDEKFTRRLLFQAALSLLALAASVTIIQFGLSTLISEFEIPINFGWIWLVLIIAAIPSLAWPFISVPRQGYAVRDKDIVFKSGVIWQKVTAIPFNRIQHVEKSSTPLDRYFRISNLKIYTAGGSAGDLRISGLSADIAERLRILILGKVGPLVEQGSASVSGV